MKIQTVRQRGFTLIELGIVVAIMMIAAAMLIPLMGKVIQDIKLRSSAETIAVLMQKARENAIKDNKFYSIIAPGGPVPQACVDLDYNGSCSSNEPSIQLAGNVQVVSSGPSTAIITCGPLGNPTTCPSGYTGMNFNPQAPGTLPSFNAHGLPCVGNPTTTQPVWPGALCYQFDQSQPSQPPVGFVYVLRYTGFSAATTNYAAVSVTPAGRINIWMYAGKDANGNDNWSN